MIVISERIRQLPFKHLINLYWKQFGNMNIMWKNKKVYSKCMLRHVIACLVCVMRLCINGPCCYGALKVNPNDIVCKRCLPQYILYDLASFEMFVFNIFLAHMQPLLGFWPNFTGMIPGWSTIKVVQTVPVGCLGRSRGQKIDFQNAIFKNLLVRNYKAQSFYIWYIASSRGPLPNLFKLCPWDQNWPRTGVTILHLIILGKLQTTSSL